MRQTTTSATPGGVPAPRRSAHIIDRALDYAALAAQGLTPAQIARRRRKSAGYVSIALRLGTALRGLSPLEIEVLRSPRVTWKVAQRIVRVDADAMTIRRKLREAVAWPPVDRRRHRRGRPTTPKDEPGVFTWRWDPEWAKRDPAGYLAAYQAFLTRLHRGVSTSLREVLAGQTLGATGATAANKSPAVRPAPPLPTTGSLRMITAALATRTRAGTAADPMPTPDRGPSDWARAAPRASVQAVRSAIHLLDEALDAAAAVRVPEDEL